MRNDQTFLRLLLPALLAFLVIGLSGCTADEDGNGTSGGGDGDSDGGIYAEVARGDPASRSLEPSAPPAHDTLKYRHS